MVSTASKPLETQRRRSSDPVSWYLSTIGRIPLLTAAEEIELGNQVQAMMAFTEDGSKDFKVEDLTTKQRRMLRIGRRAKERMMKANLRLVVSVAKKYQGKGLELLDLKVSTCPFAAFCICCNVLIILIQMVKITPARDPKQERNIHVLKQRP